MIWSSPGACKVEPDISRFPEVPLGAALDSSMPCDGCLTEELVLSMAIEKNHRKRKNMEHDARDFSHERWNKNRAYRIFRCVTKVRDDVQQGSTN